MTKILAGSDVERRRAPFDIDVVTVPPRKTKWPYHVHATVGERYIAIEGTARINLDANYIEIAPGDSIQCAPDPEHQVINESDSPFIYWLVSSSPALDTAYYPDSDK